MAKSKKGLILIIAAVAVVVVVGVVLLVALTGKSTVTEVSIGRNDMPRLSYVQGQELDLSAGVLTVAYSDGKVETLPLSSSELALSGYDKTVLGKQTVTVAYGERTTTFDVTVIPRMSVENAQTVYYVGEALDVTRGRLTIANDDASTFNVALSDATVSFQGFDSSVPAAAQTVTVRYQSGTADYSGSFDVAIYTTDNAKLTPPNKTNYRSHEEFRVNGAYITYSNGNSTFDKVIPVTLDMISGIDFSAVTAENSPLQQTGIVSYGGKEYPFAVTVTYSEVTRLQGLLKEYDFAWTEPTVPEIDAVQGERALECAKLYLTLSQTERTFIDSTSIEAAVRTAAVYSYARWYEALESCSGSFVIDDEGLKYTLSSYAAASASFAAVSDQAGPLNSELDFLNQVAELYPSLTVGGEKLEDYLALANSYSDSRTNITALLGLTTSLFEALADVPDAWTDLSAYGEAIDRARDLIADGRFGSGEYRNVYAQVSTWRENDDLFEIVYAYYVQSDDTESIDKLKGIILPVRLNELYNSIIAAIMEYSDIYNGTDSGYSTDSTLLMYYYRYARGIAEEISSGGSELYQKLYQTLTFDNVLISGTGDPLSVTFDELFRFLEQTSFGYFDLFSGVLDDPELVALWDAYLELLTISAEEEIAVKIQAFFEQFGLLSPAQQKCFLLSVNVYYDGYEKLSLDTDVNYTYLIRMLRGHYSEALSEEEFEAFRNLLLAIESYACLSDKETAIEDFLSYLAAVQSAYDGLESKTVFDENFGAVYQRYLGLAELYDESGALKTEFTVEAEWQAVFDALANEINGMFLAYSSISPEEGTDAESAFIRLYASYEAARRYADRILTDAPDNVRAAYYHRRVSFFNEYQWTLDYAMSVQAVGLGVFCYSQLTVDNQTLWEIISADDAFRLLLARLVSVVWTDAETTETIDAESAVSLMKEFLALSYEQKVLLTQLQGIDENHDYYYDGLSVIFGRLFAENESLKAAADALLEAEQAMVAYWSYTELAGTEEPDEEELRTALADARASMAKLEEALNALSQEERAQFDGYFSELVTYYQEAFAALPALE